MGTLLTFSAWQFAAAGALCALGPLVIHLLNRQRYRTVQWAAMAFLREAIQRNRRILQIRDLILLALRTAAVLLFGLALARPFFAQTNAAFDQTQPLHAILLFDNSLSMGYESLEGSLLSRAKTRATDFVEKLPPGSRISIVPVCGAGDAFSLDPYDTQAAAREAIERIELADRSASVAQAINQARDTITNASGVAKELAKRIVLFTDLQAQNWKDFDPEQALAGLGAVQVVDIPPGEWENSWIASIRVQDSLADVETPTTILVEVGHRGPGPRRDVPVTLSLGDTVIGEKTVTLEPGEATRQVDFQHVFSTLAEIPEADRPVFAALRASLPPDKLPQDDERLLVTPVVAALPVVFVDQYGEDEDAARNKIGETRHLRKLLAPKVSRGDTAKPLVQIRHLKIDQVTREVLADARLVVVAGVQNPGSAAELLRDYVRQGGRLLVAAGAEFDPAAWNQQAWDDGRGVLPLPLAPEFVGALPEASPNRLKPFSLAFESLAGQSLFQLDSVNENDLRDLYAEPFFFQAVATDESAPIIDALRKSLGEKLEADLQFLTAADNRRDEFVKKEAKGDLSETERAQWKEDDARREELRPQWLVWAQSPDFRGGEAERLSADPQERRRGLEVRLEHSLPRVLARFNNDKATPFLIERRVDRGRVLFVATGLHSSWNTLPVTNTMVLFDRLLRGMIEETLPERNFAAVERVTLPLPTNERDITVTLTRPGEQATPETLDIGYIGRDERGVTIPHLDRRGVYWIRGTREETLTSAEAKADVRPLWEIPLVVNGDAAESELDPLSAERARELAGEQLRFVNEGEEISLAGDARLGQSSWWWLIVLVLLILLVEMAMLAWPVWRDRQSVVEPVTR